MTLPRSEHEIPVPMQTLRIGVGPVGRNSSEHRAFLFWVDNASIHKTLELSLPELIKFETTCSADEQEVVRRARTTLACISNRY